MKQQTETKYSVTAEVWNAYSISYDKDFVREIKFYIPSHSRTWDERKKQWLVAPYYSGVVEVLKGRSFDKRYGLNWYSAWKYLGISMNASHALIQASVDIMLEQHPDKRNEIETARILIETYGLPHDIKLPNQRIHK